MTERSKLLVTILVCLTLAACGEPPEATPALYNPVATDTDGDGVEDARRLSRGRQRAARL